MAQNRPIWNCEYCGFIGKIKRELIAHHKICAMNHNNKVNGHHRAEGLERNQAIVESNFALSLLMKENNNP